MSRIKTQYRCRDCGAPSPRWAGRCATCGEWNTVDEDDGPADTGGGVGASGARRRPPVVPEELVAPSAELLPPLSTGMGELDRVLGGGLVTSSVTLLAGEPGIGKSTLLLQMLAGLAAQGVTSLLVSAEESADQVRRRAVRLAAATPGMWFVADSELPDIRAAIARIRPAVVVVDSIQTVSDPASGSVPGSVTQVRACAQALADDAKATGPAVILVGHVTKDGSIAGPRVLEHLVDTVLSFEGDRHHALRLLRAVKHRFGPVGETGIWEMTGAGLAEVPDAGAFLLADRRPGATGSVVFAAMDGRRPLLVEVQALAASPSGAAPRRASSGYESGRLAQLLAVLDQRAGICLSALDVYVSVVGGVRLSDPAADLAVALALGSAATGCPVAADRVVLGEVGLGGEIRHVAHAPARLAEAERMGFAAAVAPRGTGSLGAIEVHEEWDLGHALDKHLGKPQPAPRLRVVGGSPGQP